MNWTGTITVHPLHSCDKNERYIFEKLDSLQSNLHNAMIFRNHFSRLNYHYPITTNCHLEQSNLRCDFMPHVYLKSEPDKITELSGDWIIKNIPTGDGGYLLFYSKDDEEFVLNDLKR